MPRIHHVTAVAMAFATIATGAPALAQDAMFEPTSRIVRYDDLDLANERGRERLERRLRHAANAACGFWNARTLNEKQAADDCRDAAVAQAKPKVAEAVRKAAGRYARAK